MRQLFVSIFMCLCFVIVGMAGGVDANLRVKDPDGLIYAIVKVENPWLYKNRVGDKSLYHKAFGLLQVRKPYVDDINKVVGPKMMFKMWGKARLTTVDMKDKTKAVWATKVYLVYWGKQYESDTGKKVNEQVYARIHNGGPNGWRKWTTAYYWHKVRNRMVENLLALNNASKVDASGG